MRPSPHSGSPSRIPELDGIRGVAIFFVLVSHFVVGSIPAAPGTPWGYVAKAIRHTYSGVDLFFVLSGFLISRILLETVWKKNGLRVFWIRRFFRIAPLYALFLGINCLLAVIAPHYGLSFPAPSRIWPYFLSLQNFDIAVHEPSRLWAISWSLAVEEQYYVMLPILLLIFGRKGFVPLAILAITASCLLRFHFSQNAAYVLLPCRLDALAAGGLLAWVTLDTAMMNRLRRHTWICWCLFIAGVTFYLLITIRRVDRSPLDGSVFSFSYAALVLLCLTANENPISWLMRRAWLRRLGIISYPLYLFHLIVYGVLVQTLCPWTSEAGRWGLALVGGAASIVVAELLHRFVGEPTIDYGRRIVKRRCGLPKPTSPSIQELDVVGIATTSTEPRGPSRLKVQSPS